MDYMDQIIAYEGGELTPVETVRLFADLIRTGTVWQLQGHYGRVASRVIDAGIISPTGEILVDNYAEGD